MTAATSTVTDDTRRLVVGAELHHPRVEGVHASPQVEGDGWTGITAHR